MKTILPEENPVREVLQDVEESIHNPISEPKKEEEEERRKKKEDSKEQGRRNEK